ncbi:MAG TPA: serine/threonine-protein kinase, partial [Polyangiaceae bacterium]
MGTVFLATDTVLARAVALKVLGEGSASDPTLESDRVLREARLGARLQHERIARVFDVGEHMGRPFVAMEYVEGLSLRGWMDGGPRSPREIAPVVRGIAEGLAALHQSGIVHRDLKPENVMLPRDGGVKLVDFGLARHVAPSAEAPPRSGNATTAQDASLATLRGTPGYMAPEQCAGEKGDVRADVFALGVIVHELVTGRRPFRGKTTAAVLAATQSETADLTGPAWDACPAELRAATAHMLARDPSARPADGSSVLRALSGPEDAPLGGPRPGRRSGRVVAAIAASVVVLAVGAAVAVPRVGRHLAYRAALAAPPPVGMTLIDPGELVVGRSAEEVARECS